MARARAEQFAAAIAARGAIGVLFSRFLAGRVDLLPDDYLAVLAKSPFTVPPVDRASFVRTVTEELGENGNLLAEGLAEEPCWSVPGRCAWRTSFREAQYVIQVTRALPLRSSIAEMALHLRAMDNPEATAALGPQVLRQFEEWVYIDGDTSRERAFLDVLSEMRNRTHAEYPALIPEFCTARVLCWHWSEGEAFGPMFGDISPEACRQIAETLLEQISFLSFVDGELDPGAMALSPAGRIIIRRIGRPVSIPVGRSSAILRYMAATLSENSAGAANELIDLAGKVRSPQLVSRLLAAMAQTQPQLIRERNPSPFVRAFEGNWRAFASMEAEVPLFVNLIHRNLITAGALTNEPGFLQDAQAAVAGTMLRSCAADALNHGFARESLSAAGMLVEMAQTIGRLAAELRDGRRAYPSYLPDDRKASFRSRCIRQSAIAGVVMAAFLICMRWSALSDRPWSGILMAFALVAAIGLYWAVLRIG